MLVFVAVSAVQAQVGVSAPLVYSGAMDGSAAVVIDSTFFANASDEDSVIRIYRRDTGGAPVQEMDLALFLQVDPRSPETDIEAAARIGNRAYWITSYGRNKNGKERPSRFRFFATDISTNLNGFPLRPVGEPYTDLLADIIADEELKPFHLAAAAARRPKSPGGLSIEGLAATPNNQLLIGFRNPIPKKQALLVPLLNPDEVVEGKHARFGTPIQLNLGGLGIREIAFWQDEFIIIAGPPDGRRSFELFRWAGGDSTRTRIKHAPFKSLHPEAVPIYPDKGLQEFQLLSDDSTEQREFGGNVLGTSRTKHFRSIWIVP
jgi:hypothetical protein